MNQVMAGSPLLYADNSVGNAPMFKAFLEAQKKISNPTKNATNPHFKNKYANLETVIDTCKQHLLEFGFSVSQSCYMEGMTMNVTTILRHESGGQIIFNCSVPVEKNSPQGGMSAFTYGRRYGLLSALCLAAEDDDGMEAAIDKLADKPVAAKPTVKSNFSQLVQQ